MFGLQGFVKIYGKDSNGKLVTPKQKGNAITYNARNILADMLVQAYDNSSETITTSVSHIMLLNRNSSDYLDPRENQGEYTLDPKYQNSVLFFDETKTLVDITEPLTSVSGKVVKSTMAVNNYSPIEGDNSSDFYSMVEYKVEFDINNFKLILNDRGEVDPDIDSNYIKQVVVWAGDPDSGVITPRVFSAAIFPEPILLQPEVYYTVSYHYTIK